jgi:aconitate hydratase
MLTLIDKGVYLKGGKPVFEGEGLPGPEEGRKRTISYGILQAHNKSKSSYLNIKFDSLISHDITYVGIIQTAMASGLKKFPVPYVMTNCHNSLCAVGGTINADDHSFGYSAAVKFGGIYVPANLAVIHQYAREMMAGCTRMILGSDSHTRYGALGTMGIGEGGPEIVRQLLGDTYDIAMPKTVLVYLEGEPKQGVGPHDVAIALCGAVYKNGFVKNKVLEFTGPALSRLPMDFRIGIDVMTTETAALSSIWETDGAVEDYLAAHNRAEDFKTLRPGEGAYYDSMIRIDLSMLEPMAALPFHPSEAVTIAELKANPGDHLREVEKRSIEQLGVELKLTDKLVNGKLFVDQGIIAGCAGGMYDNIAEAAAILDGRGMTNSSFALSVYPPSVPVNIELVKDGIQQRLLENGALFKPCFCGPCFGAGDVPSNNGLSIRHTTRNFANREGSKPSDGQAAGVVLMDARSIAATALNGGLLTAATEVDYVKPVRSSYRFDAAPYNRRVYCGYGKADAGYKLNFGPNIVPWPEIPKTEDNLLIRLASVIHDEVTTTDELIPSGETSSYRSNPVKLASFTLSRRDPEYVGRAMKAQEEEKLRQKGEYSQELLETVKLLGLTEDTLKNTLFGSAVFARKPGDGSAREQAASCQRVLGGCANICYEFATKRYRSNCVNWGLMPFTIDKSLDFKWQPGDYVFVPGLKKALLEMKKEIPAKVVSRAGVQEITLKLEGVTEEERDILLAGCLMNWYAEKLTGDANND